MVEIIKRGVKPEEKEYQVICYTCKTEFKFKQKEGKVHHDPRDGNYVSIPCPVCANIVSVGA
jgi:hypothetical protein